MNAKRIATSAITAMMMMAVFTVMCVPASAVSECNALNGCKVSEPLTQQSTPEPLSASALKILVYSDDYTHTFTTTYPVVALDNLGLSYTLVWNAPSAFHIQLTTGGPWDLVIVDHESYWEVGNYWPDLENYLNGGGKLLIKTFDVDGSHSIATTLWQTMGVQYQSNLGFPVPVYRWDTAHPIFTTPNILPDMTVFSDNYVDDGDYVSALGTATAIAGSSPVNPNQALIVLRNDGQCILNSFLPGDSPDADEDMDGKSDMIELFENEITYLTSDIVEPPKVTKTASPTDINIEGSGVNEETTVTITVTGAGEEWAVPIPLDVVFALDSSGSMGWNDPTGLRKTAAKDFVDKMESARDQAGVVSWDDNIDFTWPLDNDFPTVKSQIDNVDSSGGTDLDVGLSSAILVLDANTRMETSEKVIIFLSNGGGTYTYAANGGPASVAASKGYVIYSIGLGSSPAIGPLTDMATATGGKYYPAPTAGNLDAIFDEIYEELTFNTIPHYVDVVEVTQRYIVDEGLFNIFPDSVNTDPVTGETTIIWYDIAQYVGNYDHGLSPDETVTLNFTAKSNQGGQHLPVDVYGKAKVNYKDSNNEGGGSVNIPQAYINVNRPPVADADGPYVADEGTEIEFNAGASSDPDGDTLQYRWDFDNDGTWDTLWLPVPTASYTWCDDHMGTAKVEVTDGALTDTATADVTVNNVDPTVVAGHDESINEGDTVSLSSTFSDPGWCDTHTATINWGDGSTESGAVTEENNPPVATGTVTGSYLYCQDGVYTVTVTVTDDDGGVGSDTLTVTVLNVLPVVDAGDDQVVTQGDTVYFSGSFEDPGCDSWTYEWDFGDYVNPVVETGTCTPGTSITATHVYTYPDIYTATLTVYDDDGYGLDTVEITVRPKYVDIDSEGVRIVYMLSRFGEVYSTRRANDNWLPYGTGPQQPPAGAEYVGVSSDGINYVYILNEEGKVYYTRRSTDNWMQYGTGRTQPPADTYVDLTSDGIRKVYILKEDGTVYYTTVANGNWMQYGTGTDPPAGDYVGIASDGINYVYILKDDGTVYYTTRYNGNWVQYGTGTAPPAGDYADIVVDGIRQVYILNEDSKVHYTTRANGNWMQYGTGSPKPPVGPSVFGYQAISSESIRQVYILNEDRAVHYTTVVFGGWNPYGTGQQSPI